MKSNKSAGNCEKIISTGAVSALMLATVIWASGGALAAGYSKASLKGAYAFHGSGLGLFAAPNQPSAGPVFQAALGTVTFDGEGHFTGTQTTSSTPMQGVPTPGEHRATGEKANPVQVTCKSKLTGTYEVNADGTGTFSVTATAEDKTCPSIKIEGTSIVSSGGHSFRSMSTGIEVPDTSNGVYASSVIEFEGSKQ